MTSKRIIELLWAERNCVARNAEGCDRNCAKCDLVQKDTELLEMYDILIGLMLNLRELAKNEREKNKTDAV